MEFYFPTELGEQLAFGAAAFTALAGFIIMFAPGYAMRLFGMQVREGRRDGYAELRSMGSDDLVEAMLSTKYDRKAGLCDWR